MPELEWKVLGYSPQAFAKGTVPDEWMASTSGKPPIYKAKQALLPRP
jgi:hypothetical protein